MSIADKLTTIAENVPKVYEAGQKSEYDRFWDLYQDYGKRISYRQAFFGAGWIKETFKPKYDMAPVDAYGMFWQSKIEGDLVELLGDLVLDVSQSTSLTYFLANSRTSRIGVVATDSCSSLSNTFQAATFLETIDLLKLKSDGTNTFTNSFNNCTSLSNITIEGVIGNNLDIHWSPLTHESIMSIINHLQTKTSGTFTLTLGSTNLAKLTDAEKAIATEKGWTLA